MTLKILGGELKGRDIKIPTTLATRPITALLRKSIFDTCQFFIEDARVLDLFAGSGAIGIEALSRGASYACFIDNGPIAIDCVRENLQKLGLRTKSSVQETDAFSFLEEYNATPFDILFIDPPYPIGLSGYHKLIEILKNSKALTAESRIFLETPKTLSKELTPIISAAFQIRKEKHSGTTTLFQLFLL